ncbi:Butyrophilin subfamily 1 member A1 [Channa argus]|uniref:Butyrophilin subfamily 1 member A1 n=1 Tax=Channa argus TaxID=215402 RepID=A0A6G1PWX3_CHAAH|nr:Butyrophilin subfamily 1 member A1 [Channa argus]KAK2905950.1 hypothetical protein Q8A73_009893 [Channa argus]
MRIFLGLLLVVAVSGDEEVKFVEDRIFMSILDSSVLLECPCSNRNENKDFRWQKEGPEKTTVFSSSNFSELYKGRAKIFVAQDRYNCSLLLTNITVNDQGKYRCSFYSHETYNRFFVYLKVQAFYRVCQKNSASNLNDSSSAKDFHCDVAGHYRDAEIQWYLDSQLLTNSSTTSITYTYSLEDPTGLHIFSSKLTTELKGTSEPKCDVKAKGISTELESSCDSKHEKLKQTVIKDFRIPFKVIPIFVVLGFSLVLWWRWKRTERLPR